MSITVQQVMDKLMVSVDPIENTVDTLQNGDPNMEVTGIVTTFMATQHVISQTLSMGANLIISHEGIFYSHQNHIQMLESDPVYQEKLRLIKESNLAIFRFHDIIHRYKPDGITSGLVNRLEWQDYTDKILPTSTILTIPSMTLRDVANYLKEKLGIPFLRVTGNLSMTCSRIGILVGYRGGGSTAIPLFQSENVDVIITGEGPEWETPEYVRDANYQGRNKALITLGHAESEEPGMKTLAETLRISFPSLHIHYISDKPLFEVI